MQRLERLPGCGHQDRVAHPPPARHLHRAVERSAAAPPHLHRQVGPEERGSAVLPPVAQLTVDYSVPSADLSSGFRLERKVRRVASGSPAGSLSPVTGSTVV